MKKILSPMEKIRFPESEELPEGVKEIDVKDTFGYCTELYPDVEYAEHSGRKLHLQIMAPLVYGKDLKWPLIVYVQGSSWHKQKLFQSLPTLVRMCERGYAVAIVEHRESELATQSSTSRIALVVISPSPSSRRLGLLFPTRFPYRILFILRLTLFAKRRT